MLYPFELRAHRIILTAFEVVPNQPAQTAEIKGPETGKKGSIKRARQGVESDGGRYRIRTYDFHRVKMALYR